MVRYFRKIRKSNYVILGLVMIVYFGNVMFTTRGHSSDRKQIQDNDRDKYAGSATCAGCHKDIYESHVKTAHYRDSRPADKETIKGNFSPGKNKFVYNKWMEVVLERKKNGYFQTGYINGIEFQSQPFDIVIGSGRKGQTYLYWDDNKLYQLPVSYYTPLNSWCNSPGYSTNFIKFDRMITSQCLECHGTFAKVESETETETVFDKGNIIFGIDCERCHGPAAKHADFHKKNPQEKTANFIFNIKKLNRQQRLDGCALCHSGFREALKPAFTFQTGDKLDDFSRAGYSNDSISTLDVHGNQYGLLMASECFKQSLQMDCSSCHNVHSDEANKTLLFSQRCMNCHNDTKHTSIDLPPAKKALLANNCIDCHMPMLPSQAIVLNVAGSEKEVPDEVRTHRIAVYSGLTRDLLLKIK